MSEDNNLHHIHCLSCGILFGIDEDVVDLWIESHKQFYCPNGHPLFWKAHTKEEEELQELRDKVKSLEEKLATAMTDLTTQTKRADELQAELEIWRPDHEGK